MKKILSVALSTAMAFSMFASVAFGADATATTPDQKFDALKTAGIVNGLPDGLAHLEKTLTRAELAKIITKSLGLKEVTGVYSYKDNNYGPNHWAAPYIEAVTAAGIMQGSTVNGKQFFNPSGNVTAQELAIVLTRALKLEVPTTGIANNAAAWAQGEVQAAINKGLLEASTTWTANATRSQAIVAAYAIWEAAQIPTVASYKVVDASNVEFTLSTGEVVKVALTTPLVANVETPVEFQDAAGHTISTKVTWVSTSAQNVKSVTADNLATVVVTFDGTVDETTAEDVDNYSIDDVTFDSATLSADKTQVTLLVDEDSTDFLTNKEETTLTISNVKSEDGTVTFSKDIDFTPADVAAPTVASVTSLGTSAFKIKFSEPVTADEAADASNYSIDGGTVAASVQYTYPNTVVVNANLAEGSHTVAVSNVTDYSGLVIAPVEQSFTVTADSSAPEVTSIKSNDLKQVVITFNETVKSVDDVYANTTSNDGTIESINDNVVTVNFDSPLSYASNTIYINGVSDYSDNSADRTATVTPTVDTVRPTIVSSSFYTEGTDYIAKLVFSKSVDEDEAVDASNYVLKDSDGDVANTDYTDSDGNPELGITLDTDDKTVYVNLGSDLDSETYTLTVSGVTDTAYVANSMLPQSISLDVASLSSTELSKAWVKSGYLYMTFSNGVTTTGTGSALDAAKYTFVDVDGETYYYDGTVKLYNTNTVRLAVEDFADSDGNGLETTTGGTAEASYIKDADGDYYTETGYNLSVPVTASNPILQPASSYVSTQYKAVVVFDTALGSVNKSDFSINSKTPTSYSLSSDKKTLTLTFSSALGTGTGSYSLIVDETPTTQDIYGNKIIEGTYTLSDYVAPVVSTTTATYDTTGANGLTVNFTFGETLKSVSTEVIDELVKDMFTVKAGDATIASEDFDVTISGNVVSVNVPEDNLPDGFSATSRISVAFSGDSSAVTDTVGNEVDAFSIAGNLASGTLTK